MILMLQTIYPSVLEDVYKSVDSLVAATEHTCLKIQVKVNFIFIGGGNAGIGTEFFYECHIVFRPLY